MLLLSLVSGQSHADLHSGAFPGSPLGPGGPGRPVEGTKIVKYILCRSAPVEWAGHCPHRFSCGWTCDIKQLFFLICFLYCWMNLSVFLSASNTHKVTYRPGTRCISLCRLKLRLYTKTEICVHIIFFRFMYAGFCFIDLSYCGTGRTCTTIISCPTGSHNWM